MADVDEKKKEPLEEVLEEFEKLEVTEEAGSASDEDVSDELASNAVEEMPSGDAKKLTPEERKKAERGLLFKLLARLHNIMESTGDKKRLKMLDAIFHRVNKMESEELHSTMLAVHAILSSVQLSNGEVPFEEMPDLE